MSKIPYGSIPGKDFVTGDESYSGTKLGIITRIDELNMKADVRVITGEESRFEIDLTQPMAGPRSFLGGIPEVNSMVIIAYRRKHKKLWEAVIIGYIPVGNTSGLKFDPYAQVDPDSIDPADLADAEKFFGKTTRYKRMQGRPGDVMGMSSGGAEFHLSKDLKLCNRAGDLLELRDTDRTLVSQSIHRVHSDSAAYTFSGAIRRGGMDLSYDALTKDATGEPTRIVKATTDSYFGRDDLLLAGSTPYIDANGKLLDRVNNADEFPPVTFSNGRRAFYASTSPASNFEDLLNGGSSLAFTEHRMEVRHVTNLQQEVCDEIDGFSMDRPVAFIEQVFGTVVGNDPFSSLGQRQYARVLKPKLFEDFDQTAAPSGFQLEECTRSPGTPDEAFTAAAGYLFKLQPPKGVTVNKFAVAINKEGKLYLNIPGSKTETYPTKNVSAEVNMEGALKMRLGASAPDRISMHLAMEGGLHLDVGPNADGQCITTNFRGGYKGIFKGNSTDDVAFSQSVQGNSEAMVSGNDSQVVNGAYIKKVDGEYSLQASRVNINALNGYTGNYGELNLLVSGKTQNQYALAVMETIVAGGRVSTVLLGGEIKNVAAGAYVQNVLAGATSFNSPAGAFNIVVGTGALAMTVATGAITLSTAAGAMALSAAAGAVAVTAGLALNLTGGVAINLLSAQVLVGGPAGVFGVARGLPMMPPGSPSLDWITGLGLQGCATFRSF